MVIIKKFIYILFLFFTLFFSVHSTENNSDNVLSYINFRLDENSTTNKVYYQINYFVEIPIENFNLKIYYDGVLVDNCEKNLQRSDTIISEKLMCDVKKLGNGEYKFVATVNNAKGVVSSITNYEELKLNLKYEFLESKSSLEFVDLGNKTLIIIEVNTNGENLKIFNYIPKEVIELLNEENKKSLIESDFTYEIIESDPLIAWNVEKAPAKINYTINKKINIEDQKKFTLEIKESSTFNKFKWIIYILIGIIIILAIRPAFKKN